MESIMNKKVIIAIILGVVLLGAGAAYFLTREDDESSNSESSQTQNTSETQDAEEASNGADTPVFEPLATTGESFVVELDTTTSDGSFAGKISYNGEGDSLFEGTFKDDELKFYDVDGKFISCQNDTCFGLPDGENGVDRSTYEYDEATINDYRNNASYEGKADCPAGTCDKWAVTDNDVDVMLYVASDGRISKAEGTSAGSEFTAVFSYVPVSITAPENVREFPLQ
jgi:hypothetical protein